MFRIDNIIRTTLFLGISAIVVSSCNKDNRGPVYQGNSGYAFASSVVYAEVSDEDRGVLEIPVYRGQEGNADQASITFHYDAAPSGASTPDWQESDPNGIFSLISPNVTFATNSCEAIIRVRFGDYSKLKTTDKYRIKLDIDDQVSPSGRSSVIVTITKKLVFEKYGDCTYFDECIFEKAYKTVIYKAVGEEIYRVADPYHEGLVAEEYAAEGWMGDTPDYVEFTCEGNHIKFTEFPTGMLFNKKYMTYAFYPSDYVWGRDFSKYDSKNLKLDDKHFQLYAVYCLPSFQYGYLNDGIYSILINIV